LAAYGVPEFHAKDFFARRKRRLLDCYADWSAKKATEFVTDLAMVIHRRRLNAICGAVNVAAFRAMAYEDRRFLTGGNFTTNGKWKTAGAPNYPYRLAFWFLLREAVDRAKDGTTVHFVFDRQNVYEGGTVQEFDAIARSGVGADKIIDSTKLGSLIFSNRYQDIALQAADLLAHSWYRELVHRDQLTDERAVAMTILSDKRRAIRVFEANDLEQLMKDAERTAGIPLELLRKMGPAGL